MMLVEGFRSQFPALYYHKTEIALRSIQVDISFLTSAPVSKEYRNNNQPLTTSVDFNPSIN